ncbi:MAG: glycosyl transferase group 1 family protein [Planctomycetota bacterium]|nr:glycosyl transferase group 1 family protein [Planctomycetota bacterium]
MLADPGRRLPSVSVIISTANRPAHYVERLLERLRAQPYRPLEVVLVVGPCPDDMRALAESQDDVKVQFITELNLARSRNIGIGLSSGEILAFIDDDAVPSHLWLHELVEALDREGAGCGGVGGATVHANASPGPLMQNRNAILHELGDTHESVRLEPGTLNDADGPWFNRLHGCNMAFRRAAIEAVGGFDETFIYQHEETDLCVRLIRAGYRIAHHPRGLVDHFPATSHFRRDAYDVSYFNILRSYTYFALKHARQSFPATAWRVFRAHVPHWKRFAFWTLTCRITPWRAAKFVGQWLNGYAKGLRLGWQWRQGIIKPRPLAATAPREFLPIRTVSSWTAPALDSSRPMRIALLCGELGGSSPGGVAVYTEHLAEGLARRGHEVVVFRSGYGPGSAKPTGYRVLGIPPEADRPHSLCVLRQLRAMAPFDLVEAPLWGGEGAAVGLSGLAPVVVRLETPLEVVRQMSGLPLSPDMVAGIGAERLGLSYASGVIAISQAIAGTVEAIYDVRLATHARLSTVIPIGVPAACVLSGDEANPPEMNGVRFLYLGRLEARKGILDLGAAFLRAAKQHADLTLWIAGSDNSESDGHRARTGQTYEQTLRAMWGPDIARRVRFLGRVTEDAKNLLMAHCDVFVAPSLYESFGIVFLEAMRLGKPVIGTDVGGIPEIVIHGETGLLVPANDPEQLAQAMLALASDSERRNRLGGSGLERFQSRFTIDEFARRSESFYREVIAHWQGSRFAEAVQGRVEPATFKAA